MTTFAIQYLEPGPGIAAITPRLAREKLRASFDRLPISHVLVGWNLPRPLVEACRTETRRAGARLFLWHPLLTGDGDLDPHPSWCTIGPEGESVPGFRNMPKFTFMCPNRPIVRQQILEHLARVLQRVEYDGVFLDRIRFPSPTADPGRWLACFCTACRAAADRASIDLASVRCSIERLQETPENSLRLLRTLFGATTEASADADTVALERFLKFREECVSDLILAATQLVHSAGLCVGLDCFSPVLTRMVGQDLKRLNDTLETTDWVKIMTYGHALGPAGLPFELLALHNWLASQVGQDPRKVLSHLSASSGLPMPSTPESLRDQGLPPEALYAEIKRARAAGVTNLMAGVELVDIRGVAELHKDQISDDLCACFSAGADGLVLSWDLWHIPLDRLDLVRSVWSSQNRRNLDESTHLS